MAEALPDPLLVLDGFGTVLCANGEARGLTGLDPSGQHVSAAIRAPHVLEAIERVLSQGENERIGYERRVPVERKFEAWISAIGREQLAGRPAALVMLRDLTREQQIERMRADFVAHASHELRTPLAAVLGAIDTLEGPAKADEGARSRFLGLMRTQAERMRRLIDDLLSLSRIEMNVHQRPEGHVDLAGLAQSVRDNLADLARRNEVVIHVDIAPGLAAEGDLDELIQLVQNLVENAIKYAASGRRVDVTGGVAGNTVSITVRDYGPGIAAEHLPRLTERFYRVSAQESRARGGTGLGLAIVKHILNRHRGRLQIASELGKGSAFTVSLPVAKY
jgi:two-component system phosphate regulon sensor histidine kinase PhoR